MPHSPRVLLAANVARTYFQLGRLFEQHQVAERALAQRDEILALISQRVEAATQEVAYSKTLLYPNINLVAFAG